MPALNGSNATSFLLGRSIRLLKPKKIRAVITLADDSRHVGSIYQVCNFKYYGLTNKQKDFYCVDGKVNARGETKDKRGVWMDRTRKHRYAYIIDPKLKCNYSEESKPTILDIGEYGCCGGRGVVFDNRHGEWFNCPICGDIKIPVLEDDKRIVTNEVKLKNRVVSKLCKCGGRLRKVDSGLICEDCFEYAT